MKIFLGWSGDISKHFAETLRDWLSKMMAPHAQIFVSFMDIGLGVHWNSALSDALTSANFGILCVTPDNMNAHWIYYETGQMEVAMRQNNPNGVPYIAPLLFGVKHSGDLPSPLSHYQSAKFSRETMWHLVREINGVCRQLYITELSKSGPDVRMAYFEEYELARKFDGLYAELETKIAELESNIIELESKQAANSPTSPNVSLSPASPNPAESKTDVLVALSVKMEDIYLRFGSYPEIARAYYEGKQLLNQLRDESISQFEKSQDLLRFYEIVAQAVDSLRKDITDSNPNRKIRMKELRELQALLEGL